MRKQILNAIRNRVDCETIELPSVIYEEIVDDVIAILIKTIKLYYIKDCFDYNASLDYVIKIINPPRITFDGDLIMDKTPELPVKPDTHIDGHRDRLKLNTSGNKRRSSDKPGENHE